MPISSTPILPGRDDAGVRIGYRVDPTQLELFERKLRIYVADLNMGLIELTRRCDKISEEIKEQAQMLEQTIFNQQADYLNDRKKIEILGGNVRELDRRLEHVETLMEQFLQWYQKPWWTRLWLCLTGRR